MSDKNHEPAFPQPCTDDGHASNNHYAEAGGGMTLRDYFAAKAMASADVSLAVLVAANITRAGDDWMPRIAKDAYKLADEMMEARKL